MRQEITVSNLIEEIKETLNSTNKDILAPLRKNQSVDITIYGFIKVTLYPEDVIISIDNSGNKLKKK